jgi:hypothetical protein
MTEIRIPEGVGVWFSAMDRHFQERALVGCDDTGDMRNTWLARRALQAMGGDETPTGESHLTSERQVTVWQTGTTRR